MLVRYGAADVMLAGGSEACITPLAMSAFGRMGALSSRVDDPSRASRPFDPDRDGFVMGEGSGFLVLEEWDRAVARGAPIWGEVVGYGRNADAYHVTAPAPGGVGAVACMQAALADAGLQPSDIGHVNAHGTSTPLNDRVETMAVKGVLGDRAPVSSTKSMTGHLLGAAGALEAIVCLKVLENGVLPPTVNYEEPDPSCDLDYVPNRAREAEVDVAMSNSFGFGGHNATLVFRRA